MSDSLIPKNTGHSPKNEKESGIGVVSGSGAGNDAGASLAASAPGPAPGPTKTGASLGTHFRKLWARHHLAFAVAGCTLFLAAGWIASAMGASPSIYITLYVLAYVSGGVFSLRDGIVSLIEKRRIDVDMLMVIAATAAASIGEWLEGGILLFLFSLSNALQFYAMDRTRRAITALMSARPREALVRQPSGETRIVPVDDLNIGDVMIVRPGELVPSDGTIVSGNSSLNEASITGESIPVEKTVGDEVFGGTLNQNGALDVRVTKLAEDTVIAKVIRMVEEAQSEEAPTQRRIDIIEQYYAMAVIAITILAAAIPIGLGYDSSSSIYRAITLLVVASPCAIAMAVPAPIVAAIANGARSGVLFKGGIHIENMAELKVIAFDKTGTLTEGRPSVTDIIPMSGWDQSELLALAAAVESSSEHLLAQAVLQAAASDGVEPPHAFNAQALPGKGIAAEVEGYRQVWVGNRRLVEERVGSTPAEAIRLAEGLESAGKTVMFVGVEDQVIGLIAALDLLRAGAAQMIADLKAHGIQRVVMLTGDNKLAAEAIGRQAGIDEVYAALLPNEKAAHIAEMRQKYGPIAMVGDGVNDAPALAQATIGVAMGAVGTDVALETADVVLMSNDLAKINHALSLSRRTRKIIGQNLAFALGVIGVLVLFVLARGLVLAAGVVGHEGSTILVIFNSLRLLFGQHRGNQLPGGKGKLASA